jgi:hypothetical protein
MDERLDNEGWSYDEGIKASDGHIQVHIQTKFHALLRQLADGIGEGQHPHGSSLRKPIPALESALNSSVVNVLVLSKLRLHQDDIQELLEVWDKGIIAVLMSFTLSNCPQPSTTEKYSGIVVSPGYCIP